MPLKHPVETLLVFILAVVVAATGLIIAVLPPLPEGAFVWGIAFLIVNAYPLALYPLFKKRRADYEFRALHFLPALMLLLWLALELLIPYAAPAAVAQSWYTWGWALPGVVVSIILLAWYSLHVLRQRRQRMWLLTGVLATFLILGVGAQQWTLGQKMTAAVRGGVYRLAGLDPDDGRILTGSINRTEEVWRMKMRRQERRDERIAANVVADGDSSSLPVISSSSSAPLIAVNTSLSAGQAGASSKGESLSFMNSSSSAAPPPKLSPTGPVTEAFSVLFVAGYCATLQRRAKRRMA